MSGRNVGKVLTLFLKTSIGELPLSQWIAALVHTHCQHSSLMLMYFETMAETEYTVTVML